VVDDTVASNGPSLAGAAILENEYLVYRLSAAQPTASRNIRIEDTDTMEDITWFPI
jgi:hypothetical protein